MFFAAVLMDYLPVFARLAPGGLDNGRQGTLNLLPRNDVVLGARWPPHELLKGEAIGAGHLW
jgi:hypothetical protein